VQPVYLGIDPGLTKCGYAIIAPGGERLSLAVVPVEQLYERLERDLGMHEVRMICVGNATMSEKTVRQIRGRWPLAPMTIVDEHNTTLDARRLYYEDHPPRGLLRLIPRGLLVPREPLDGYAALLIVERYVKSLDKQGT